MNDLDFHIGQLVIANRILANEGVVDAYGHVSMRIPTIPNATCCRGRAVQSWSSAPTSWNSPWRGSLSATTVARLISKIYSWRDLRSASRRARGRARPCRRCAALQHHDNAAAAGHTLRQFMGAHVPVWDIADTGDHANNLR